METLWRERPQDGIQIGRDIPSKKAAPLLAGIMVAETTEDGKDFAFTVVGETIRARFGGYVVGQRISELLAPEVFAFHMEDCNQLLLRDEITILNCRLLSRDTATKFENIYLRYELIKFFAWSANRSRKNMVAGLFAY